MTYPAAPAATAAVTASSSVDAVNIRSRVSRKRSKLRVLGLRL